MTEKIDEKRPQAVDRVRVRVLPDGRLSRRDSAAYLGVAEKTLAMWNCQGKGPKVHKVGGRVWHYIDELDEFVREGDPNG